MSPIRKGGLLNHTTTIEASKTAGEIVALLVRHGARQVLMDYDGRGQVIGISWRVPTKGGDIPYTLPINAAKVNEILTKQYHQGQVPRAALRDGQAERVAWRILKDWVEAQMALLETTMVTLEEIFLGYMLVGPEETLYKRMLRTGFQQKALGPGNKEEVQ
ncbi:MAG: hypothetical protein Q7K03_02375 [Dehalococcoidia bacterium]|nr:hypothetical protein [Dehalococcoidia bacterium]